MRQPGLAMVGLGVIAILCVMLLRDVISLETAALRAIMTVVVLALCDRIAVPIGRALLTAKPAKPAPSANDNESDNDDRRVP